MSLTDNVASVASLARNVITNVASWVAVAAIGAVFLMWSDLKDARGEIAAIKAEQTRMAAELAADIARIGSSLDSYRPHEARIAVLESALPRIERQLDTILTYIREERSPRPR